MRADGAGCIIGISDANSVARIDGLRRLDRKRLYFMKTNYHTHTARCRHASGTEAEYVEAALHSGFDVLGFADHCPWPFDDGFESTFRMLPDEFDGYVECVRGLKREYAGRIEIYCGLECEYYPDMLGWIDDLADANGLDYLILGNHYALDERTGMYCGACHTPADLRHYVACTTKGMATGMFSYLAHPDLCFRTYRGFDPDCAAASRELCQCARQLDMPLEYNLLGVLYHERGMHNGLGYPCDGFWEIAAQEGVKCIIGVDAHSARQLANTARYDAAVKYLKDLGLERVERIRFRHGARQTDEAK